MSDTHGLFITLSYGVTFLVIAALVARAVLDARGQRRTLDELESRGARRRSGTGKERP